jgi:hypothetical protein
VQALGERRDVNRDVHHLTEPGDEKPQGSDELRGTSYE